MKKRRSRITFSRPMLKDALGWLLLCVAVVCLNSCNEISIKNTTPGNHDADTTAPQPASSVVDQNVTTSTTAAPAISWTASPSANETNFSGYEIALGSSAGATDILSWTNIGNVTSYTPSVGFTLIDGTVYYATVRAANTNGLKSTAANGDGFVVNSTAATFSCDFTSSISTDCYANPYIGIARPLVRFYRAGGANTSPGTYVNSAGVIASATTSLVTYSEQLDHANWSVSNGAVTANAAVSPDGSTSAEELNDNTAAAYAQISQVAAVPNNSNSYTASIYIKAGTSAVPTGLRLGLSGGTGIAAVVLVDLSNGTATAHPTFIPSSYSISSAGNGWYRVSVTATNNSTGNTNAGLVIYPAHGSGGGQATNTGSVYLWGAQLDAGTSATNYTYSAGSYNYGPRLDHDPASCSGGTCTRQGLLIEEQRANLMRYSGDLSNAVWGLQSGLTRTATAGIAPDGTNTATLLTDSDAAQNSYLQQGATIADDNSTWTCSAYLKQGTAAATMLLINLTGGTTAVSSSAVVTWSTKALSNCTTCTITPSGNDWYRVSVTSTNNTTGNTSGSCYVYPANWVTGGTTTGTIYAWGAQLESGAFPTSFIPTTTAALTRTPDFAIAYTLAPAWFDTTKGSLYSSAIFPRFTTNQFLADINDGGGNNRIGMYATSTSQLVFNILNAGAQQFGGLASSVSANSVTKAFLSYRANDNAGSLNGANAITSTSGTVPTVDRLSIGMYNSGVFRAQGWIREVKYYNVDLGDNQIKFGTK